MGVLLIVDVQKTFKDSKRVLLDILEYQKQFSSVYYCYDIISGDGEDPHDMWDEMVDEYYAESFQPNIFTKEYAFFRSLMDEGHSDELIVDLGRLMLKYNLTDAREISESDFVDKFHDLFKSHGVEIDFEELPFYLPHDLLESLSKLPDNVIIVGGGVNECLKEVELLMQILEKPYSVNNQFCY